MDSNSLDPSSTGDASLLPRELWLEEGLRLPSLCCEEDMGTAKREVPCSELMWNSGGWRCSGDPMMADMELGKLELTFGGRP